VGNERGKISLLDRAGVRSLKERQCSPAKRPAVAKLTDCQTSILRKARRFVAPQRGRTERNRCPDGPSLHFHAHTQRPDGQRCDGAASTALALGVRHIGFKDIGLPARQAESSSTQRSRLAARPPISRWSHSIATARSHRRKLPSRSASTFCSAGRGSTRCCRSWPARRSSTARSRARSPDIRAFSRARSTTSSPARGAGRARRRARARSAGLSLA
jgi:hypothetical protein